MADDTDLAEAAQSEGAVAGAEGVDLPAARRKQPSKAQRALMAGGLLIAAGTALWLARAPIAQSLIDRQLGQLGLPGHYTIDSIGTDTQVLRDIVIGDPAHPDLTITRATVALTYGLTGPRLGRITLEQPRLYGTYRNGQLSFGALDPVLFPKEPSKAPFRLPDLDLRLVDGRALIESDYGRLAVKAEGAGNLAGGFAGTLAALAPHIAGAGCAADRLTAYGKITVQAGKPGFAGPLRLAALKCGKDIALTGAALALDLRADADLAGATLKGRMESGALAAPGLAAQKLALGGEGVVRAGAIRGHVFGTAAGVRSASLAAKSLGLDGDLQAASGPGTGWGSVVFRGTVAGEGLARGASTERALVQAQTFAQGTLLGPMIAQIRIALGREERGNRLTGDVVLRREPQRWSLVMPTAVVRGSGGQALLSVSRLQVAGEGAGLPRLAGNFVMAGAGLPQISGRMEQGSGVGGGGGAALRLRMAEYRAGGGSLALPALEIAQGAGGALSFTGTAQLSGAIPGGAVSNLSLPIAGTYDARGELALFPHCISPRFDRLQFGQLTLDRRQLTVCPVGGQAIVRSGARGLAVVAGTSAFALTGRLGTTPLVLKTGAVGLAWPGTLTARGVDVALGPQDAPTRLHLGNLVAQLGKDFSGTFDGVEARLAAVPIDVTGAAGQWRYAGQTLTLSGIRLDATDRLAPARFERLTAENAGLTLKGNRIEAEALLREPQSGRDVVRLTVRHDLASASGHADLAVDGIVFDDNKRKPGVTGGLQPKALTLQLKGIVTNAAGTVRGAGRVDWDTQRVTSTGTFSTDNFAFAAAFGPVRGLSGSLVFTDLIGMVTAPHQTLRIASVNPGIEVNDGVIDLELLADQVVRLNGGVWPFLGGSLRLAPTDLRVTTADARHFTLDISGLNAAKFVERMEMANLSATGIFDGRLPLEFDANGGRIKGGMLVSRAPGGTVSYVGALTYKDLSAMANFAFDALKSMDYTTMTIGMDGDLAGDVVTKVQFAGIKQGAGTKQNFLTRQIAGLPLQFNVNIRAPFYRLINSMTPPPPPSPQGARPVLPPTFPAPASAIQPPVSAATP